MNSLFPLASLLAGRRSLRRRESSSTWERASNFGGQKRYFGLKNKITIEQKWIAYREAINWLLRKLLF